MLTAAHLTLNASGRVLQANAGAGRLWQTEVAKLAGMPLPSLFCFEIVSADPEWAEAQWDVLLSAAQDRTITLQAQPFEPGPVDVQLRLEAAAGGRRGLLCHRHPDRRRAQGVVAPGDRGGATCPS